MRRSTDHQRRGSIYMAVLSGAMIVTVIGLSAIAVVRVQRRTAEGVNDFSEARLYAQSAIEMGLLWIDSDPDWRNTYSNGVWASNAPLGAGMITLSGTDPADGDLADSDRDSMLLTGVGVKGEARYKLQVGLYAEVRGLSCLETSLHGDSYLEFDEAVVNSDQLLSSNDYINESDSTINADVEAVNSVSGSSGNYTGSITQGVPARDMPDTATVFDHYKVHGTYIDPRDLPLVSGFRVMTDVVLSPASNPYGANVTNAEGIYVIDALNTYAIRFRNCRIVGTIVLLNASSVSRVSGGVNWAPALANYPALMVQGPLNLYHDGLLPLDEAARGVNFNPNHTPYQSTWDFDTLDTYPSVIKGLIYVTGNVRIRDDPVVDGAIVAGSLGPCCSGVTLNLTYQPTYLDNPPPGFAAPARMVIAPGTWRQVVD